MAVIVHDAAPYCTHYAAIGFGNQTSVIRILAKVTDINLETFIFNDAAGRSLYTFRDKYGLVKEIAKQWYLCGVYWSNLKIHKLGDICVSNLRHLPSQFADSVKYLLSSLFRWFLDTVNIT